MLLLPAQTLTGNNRIHHGDALTVLRGMASGSVNTIVTSPPYFGLRDYGVDGQIGLEQTPAEYVAALVAVFREARRVLRDDGTLFLNLGDSYYSPNGHSGGGSSPKSTLTGGGGKYRAGSKNEAMYETSRALRAQSYGNGGKEERGSIDRDLSSRNLCDEHRDAWLSRIVDIDCRLAHEQVAELCQQIPASMEALRAHLPTGDYSDPQLTKRSLDAIQDQAQTVLRAVGQVLAFPSSMTDECAPQPPGGLTRTGMLSVFLASIRSLTVCVQEFAHKWDAVAGTLYCNQDSASLCAELVDHIQCTSGYCSLVASWLNSPYIQPHCTTFYSIPKELKPKNLLGIPWRMAFALQDDGWILRSDIIWAKPNPMPESVTDRPTKAHEYIFLFAKSPRYYYDADAVREPHARLWDENNIGDNNGWVTGVKTGRVLGRKESPNNGLQGSMPNPLGRNRRTVWNVATQPFKGAHFATFPPKLIEPCILAGCPAGGVVLDTFFGAGTTGAVAVANQRRYVGIEINPEYIEIARQRIQDVELAMSLPVKTRKARRSSVPVDLDQTRMF